MNRLSLPYRSLLPDDPRRRRAVRRARIGVYILVAVALIAPILQFQHSTVERLNRIEGKRHKGALARWQPAVRGFWAGHNIYAKEETAPHRLHPNMPFVVILLTPLTALPAAQMGLALNIAKLAAIVASILMLASLAAHHRQKVYDWVLALGFGWVYLSILSDVQHGNTNVFVMFLVVLHLWLYRRGSDLGAGAALAAAICLKMTPALFVLYWLYQRNWRLVAYTAAAGVVFVVGVPAAVVGVDRYVLLMRTWLNNLIIPGLVRGAWYPIHVNQSLSGMVSRLFLGGAEGDAFYNPDDYLHYGDQPMSGYVTVAALSANTVRWMLRAGQVAIVGLMAWGIGWRRLARDDGRRLLHFGIVTLGMMLLNQRTWTHHGTVLLVAAVALWQAIGFGLMSRRVRACCLWAMLGVLAITWTTASDIFRLYARLTGDAERFGELTINVEKLHRNIKPETMEFGELWADVADAYGPQFWCFAAMLAVSIILARILRKGDSPYAAERQKLSAAIPPAR
ncbi:MAG TPA: DUF2029 domain-containing protein [Phycisphaerae bacterium]|nr:DUF2029 domain-containing protein [Phycisphaerae bacterium]